MVWHFYSTVEERVRCVVVVDAYGIRCIVGAIVGVKTGFLRSCLAFYGYCVRKNNNCA
mgnify:CR=1 FL=1